MSKENEMNQIISGTAEYRSKIVKLLTQYKDIINASEDYKFLCNFVLLFSGYQEEIMILQGNKKYIAALPLTRISIECYSTIKILVTMFRGNPILPYNKELTMQLLAYHDIYEEIILFMSLRKSERKMNIGNQYTDSIVADILSVFDESYIYKKSTGEISLSKTKEKMEEHFKEKFDNNEIPSNLFIIKAALRNNELMKYEDGDIFSETQFIYTELSKACHNTVCSMKDRIEIEIDGIKYSSVSKEHKNNLSYMQINFNCLCDVYNEMKELLV